MKTWKALFTAAVTAAALTAAGSASAVTCTPPTGAAATFNPINPAPAVQFITNTGQLGGGLFSCSITVDVINGAPLVEIAANIVDSSESVVVGDQITFDVFQGATLLLNDAIAGLSQQDYLLTGPVLAGIPLTIIGTGTFENLGVLAGIAQQYSLFAVPGPLAGAGLPALLALGGFVWLRRRKHAAV
jgi:LPXTG-motif cell wall-anchored protein